MMEKLIYKNGRGESVTFSPYSPYWVDICRDVQGLNDMENEIYTNELTGQNKSLYLGHKKKAVDIKIKGWLYARSESQVRKLKNKLNRVLIPDNGGVLLYSNGLVQRSIACVAEVSPHYSKDEVLESFQVEFLRLDRFWKDASAENSKLAQWHAMFSFPLEIDEEEGIEFGVREESLIINVFNAGDVEAGFLLRIVASGDVKNPELINVRTGEFIKLNIDLQYGDIVELRTQAGEKSVLLLRGGQSTNILNKLVRGSVFLQLHPRDNLYRYNAQEGIDNMDINIQHNNLYATCYEA